MSHIKEAFKDGKALIGFLTAGVPSAEDTLRYMGDLETAVADDGDDFVLEDLLGLLQGKFGAGDDVFLRSAKINLGHNSYSFLC